MRCLSTSNQPSHTGKLLCGLPNSNSLDDTEASMLSSLQEANEVEMQEGAPGMLQVSE